MPALAELLGDADPLAFQIADARYRLVGEQLVAAGMQSRQRRDRLAGIHLVGDPCRGLEVEVDVAPRDRVDRQVRHVADLGEPFRPEQVLGDVHRRAADVGYQPSRMVVTSGGPSSASDALAPRALAAAADRMLRKSRRERMICMRRLLKEVRRRSPIESLPRAA